jgi:DNA polymerase-2
MNGMLFDLWEERDGVFLSVLNRESKGARAADSPPPASSHLSDLQGIRVPYGPLAFATGDEAALKRLGDIVLRKGWATRVGWTQRREFWSNEWLRALGIRLRSPAAFDSFRRWVEHCRYDDRFPTVYHLDFPVVQHFLLEQGIFPTARIRLAANGRITTADDRWATDYALPPLRLVEMRLARSTIARPSEENPLFIRFADEEQEIFAHCAEEWLDRLESIFRRYDPDVVITAGGDERLLQLLQKMAHRAKRRFPLDRFPAARATRGARKGRSLVSYGRIYYMSPEFPIYGRWHLDTENTFLFSEADLPGVIELARLAGLPVPLVARSAIGSIMTALQIAEALRQGYLIPPQKQQVEDWKTAEELLRIDKGGLYFRPPVGTFANVAEIDFSQMYPAIMVRHNISPETVNCACCAKKPLP